MLLWWHGALGYVALEPYGLPPSIVATWQPDAVRFTDSAIKANPLLKQDYKSYGRTRQVQRPNYSFTFYWVLFLLLFLGVIRTLDPRFFQRLRESLLNPTQFKSNDLTSGSIYSINHTLLNAFSSFSIGTFIWLVLYRLGWEPYNSLNSVPNLLFCILGVPLLYMGKFLFLKTIGWATGLGRVFDQYSSNVFLINKILGIVLVPMICILAFAPAVWAIPLIIIGITAYIILLILRYTRSWKYLSPLIQISKFHFFMYICAAEILPVMILWKLAMNGFNL